MKPDASSSDKEETSDLYSFFSPLWLDYFKRVRKTVRFPRNQKNQEDSDQPDCGCD